MRKFLILLAVPFLLAGCGGLTDMLGSKPLALLDEAIEKGRAIEDKTFDAAADAVDKYCESVPDDVRLYLRDSINSRTEHGNIVVTCE